MKCAYLEKMLNVLFYEQSKDANILNILLNIPMKQYESFSSVNMGVFINIS